MRVKLTSRVTIEAPVTQVFAYLSNPKRHHLWNPHLQSITATEPFKKGSKYHTTSLLLGIKLDSTNVVSDLVPDKLLEIRNSEAALEFCVAYLVEAEGKGAAVKCVTTVSTTGRAFAFARPVLKLLAQREIQSDLQALKIAVEQKLQ